MGLTKEEIKTMIDATINENGERSITGKALNLALNAVVDYVGFKRSDVNFFDYDGTLLYAYTWEEAKELTELPPVPEHDGMTTVGWNYTLRDIKQQGGQYLVDDYGHYLFVGTLNIAGVDYLAYNGTGDYSDGYCALIFENENTLNGYYAECVNNDGSAWQILEPAVVNAKGEMRGKADVGACFKDANGDYVPNPSDVLIIPYGYETLADWIYNARGVFSIVSIPNTITIIDSECFTNAIFTEELKIPANTLVAEHYHAFSICSFDSIWMNLNIEWLNYFYGSANSPFKLQDGVTIVNTVFKDLKCDYVIYPNSIMTIEYGGLYDAYDGGSCPSIRDFSRLDHIPYCDESYPAYNNSLIIIVPDNLYDEWINDTNWSGFADYIVKASDNLNGNNGNNDNQPE